MKPTRKSLLIAGALHLDELATTCSEPVMNASNPVQWTYSVGGVATNTARSTLIADEAYRNIALTAAIGTDPVAESMVGSLQKLGLQVHGQVVQGAATGRYSAIVDPQGELLFGLSDVDLAKQLTGDFVAKLFSRLAPEAILMDANLSEHCLNSISELCMDQQLSLTAMAVSPAKAQKLLPIAAAVDVLFCNRREAISLADPQFESSLITVNGLADKLCKAGFSQFVLTDEDKDVLVQTPEKRNVLPVPAVAVKGSVNGAGDALAGASFAAYTNNVPLDVAVRDFGLPQAMNVISGKQRPVSIRPAKDASHG